MIFPVLRLLGVSAAVAFRRAAAILARALARNVVPGPKRSNRRLRPAEDDVTTRRSDEMESPLRRHARAETPRRVTPRGPRLRRHPRLSCGSSASKTGMAGTSPAMTPSKWLDMTGTRSSPRQRALILTWYGRAPLMGPWGCDLPTSRQPKHRLPKPTLTSRPRPPDVVACIVA